MHLLKFQCEFVLAYYIGRQEKSKVVSTLLSALLGLKGRGSPVKYLLGVGLLGNLLLRSGFLLGVLQA